MQSSPLRYPVSQDLIVAQLGAVALALGVYTGLRNVRSDPPDATDQAAGVRASR